MGRAIAKPEEGTPLEVVPRGVHVNNQILTYRSTTKFFIPLRIRGAFGPEITNAEHFGSGERLLASLGNLPFPVNYCYNAIRRFNMLMLITNDTARDP